MKRLNTLLISVLMLAGLSLPQAWAKKEYISTDPQSIAKVCAANGMVSILKGESDCIACHTNADPDNPPSAPDDRNANGKIYELYRVSPSNFLNTLLKTFCIAEGPPPPAPVPQTGQTPTAPINPTPIGADGALEKGVVWPIRRFTDHGDGTISDALTGLVWLKDANCTDTVGGVKKNGGTLKWSQALTWSNALANGKCGLTDGSAAGDWRLPNLRELHSLVDLSQTYGPALPAWHPFWSVWSTGYWSSSTVALATGQAWILNFRFGDPGRLGKASRQFVWPVRDAWSQSPFKIGDTYQGGIVFYIDRSGAHGLIAAPSDQSTAIRWSNGIYVNTGATATAVGTGQANTAKIIAAQGAGDYAATLADNLELNGYSDWFLPSRDELNLIYRTIGPGAPWPLTNIGGFSSAWYWSSSEDYSYSAWYQHFGYGSQSNTSKIFTHSLRAVRAF